MIPFFFQLLLVKLLGFSFEFGVRELDCQVSHQNLHIFSRVFSFGGRVGVQQFFEEGVGEFCDGLLGLSFEEIMLRVRKGGDEVVEIFSAEGDAIVGHFVGIVESSGRVDHCCDMSVLANKYKSIYKLHQQSMNVQCLSFCFCSDGQVNIMVIVLFKMKSILLLGSGLMTESVIVYLLANPKNRIHIASNVLEQAKKLAEKRGLDRCTYSEVNVQDSQQLKAAVFTADIVISYVPASFHVFVARACLELGKHLITASYISKEMQDLDQEVKAKGLIFLNQMGLDPGIDHMTTMKTIDEVKEKKGKVLEYESWCGGLPSPTSCDNPLGYKFTWSPIGAFQALRNKAAYIDKGDKVEIPAADLLYSKTEVRLNQALTLQGYPNRDSISYREVYGLNDATKLLRGTLRYAGFLELINAFKEIGYFSDEPTRGNTWLQYTKLLLQGEEGGSLEEKIRNRTVSKVKHYLSATKEENQHRFIRILKGLKFFGLLSDQKIHDKKLTSLQNLIKLVQPKLSLKPGETDLVAMQHRFVIQINGKRYLRKSSLIQIGDKKGFSAMAITVGVPTAIAAELVLQGRIKQRGVLRPVFKDIYEPTLHLLQKAGIKLVEEEEQL